MKYATALLTVSTIAITCGAPAVAQEAAMSNAGDIVVTAQKRDERLQDIPVAISALDSTSLERRGIADVSDIGSLAPNLTSNKSPGASTSIVLQIRGIGGTDTILTQDSPVSMYVDGVIVGRATGAIFDMVDLERVEVLRGPQGTLYGRNTTGGAVNFITKKPSEELGVSQALTYGRFNDLQSRTIFNTGDIGDTGLKFKFSYLHKQRNGYFDNLNEPSRNDPGAYNVDAFRAAARFDNGGPLRVDYTFDYSKNVNRSVPFQMAGADDNIVSFFSNSVALGGRALEVSRDKIDSLYLRDGPITDEVKGHTVAIEYDVSDSLMIRSLTGYREWNNKVEYGDYTGNDGIRGFMVSPEILGPSQNFVPLGVRDVSLFHASNVRTQSQISEEINIIGNISDRVEYVVGGYYFREKVSEDNPQNITLILPAPSPIPLGGGLFTDHFGVPVGAQMTYKGISSSWAVFGQSTFHVTDQLSLTGGLRYTEDKKRLMQTAAAVRDTSRKFRQANWSATVAYNPTEDLLLYAKAATGYKAGGFNPRSTGDGYDPEKLTSYEIGMKSDLLDRMLRLNLTGFHSRYRDMQVDQFLAGSGGATSITVNAGKATYTGVEAEISVFPTSELMIDASVGYVGRKYKEFIIRDPMTDNLVNVADEARFKNSASTTINIGAQYQTDIESVGRLSLRADWLYRTRVYFNPLDRFNKFNPLVSDGPVGRFNGRISLSEIDLAGARATIAFWGKNITNRKYLDSAIDFGGLGFAGVVFAEPRTFGLDLKLEL